MALNYKNPINSTALGLLVAVILFIISCKTSSPPPFVSIEDISYEIDTLPTINPETYAVYYREVKTSKLFRSGITETYRDTIKDGRTVRAFGEKGGKTYQILEINFLY